MTVQIDSRGSVTGSGIRKSGGCIKDRFSSSKGWEAIGILNFPTFYLKPLSSNPAILLHLDHPMVGALVHFDFDPPAGSLDGSHRDPVLIMDPPGAETLKILGGGSTY